MPIRSLLQCQTLMLLKECHQAVVLGSQSRHQASRVPALHLNSQSCMFSSEHNAVTLCSAQVMQGHLPSCRSSGASIPAAKLQSTPSVDSTDASAMTHNMSSWAEVESSASTHMRTALLPDTGQVPHHTAPSQACHTVHSLAHLVLLYLNIVQCSITMQLKQYAAATDLSWAAAFTNIVAHMICQHQLANDSSVVSHSQVDYTNRQPEEIVRSPTLCVAMLHGLVTRSSSIQP